MAAATGSWHMPTSNPPLYCPSPHTPLGMPWLS